MAFVRQGLNDLSITRTNRSFHRASRLREDCIFLELVSWLDAFITLFLEVALPYGSLLTVYYRHAVTAILPRVT